MKKNSILAITIPTYNRSELLKILLDSIFEEYKNNSWPSDLEIIVIDNASKDDTVEMLNNRIKCGDPIKIIVNNNNIGVDANLLACFEATQAEYIWQIGDDEILYCGALKWVLNFCRNNDFGLLHLQSNGFINGEQLEHRKHCTPEKIKINKLTSEEMIRQANVYLTFISANVLNRRKILECNLNFNPRPELNSNLIQMTWIYSSLNLNINNYYVKTCMFGALTGNSGGYKLIKVFGENLKKITSTYLDKKYPNSSSIISNAVLTRLLPSEIFSQSKNIKNKFENEEMQSTLKILFSKYIFLNIFVLPLFSGNALIRKISLLSTMIFNKINKIFNYKFL
jgi:abequosyltransferase